MATKPAQLEYVVVIGAARSGTKFVRDVIGSSTVCCTVPFDVNYVWRHGFDNRFSDELDVSQLDDVKAGRIQNSLQHLSGWRENHGHRMIVEKTVSNCLRVPLVERALPGVRFVHLIRDGRDATESCYRQWNAPFSWRYGLQKLRYVPWSNRDYLWWYARNLVGGRLAGRRGVKIWGVRYQGIERDLKCATLAAVCARQWVECIIHARRDLQSIPTDRWLEVRYEDLVADESQVVRLCDFLHLPDEDRVLQHYRKNLRTNSSSRPVTALSDWDAALLELLVPELRELGYVEPADETRHAA